MTHLGFRLLCLVVFLTTAATAFAQAPTWGTPQPLSGPLGAYLPGSGAATAPTPQPYGGAQPYGVTPQPYGGTQPYGVTPQPYGGAQPYGVTPQPYGGAQPYGVTPQPYGGAQPWVPAAAPTAPVARGYLGLTPGAASYVTGGAMMPTAPAAGMGFQPAAPAGGWATPIAPNPWVSATSGLTATAPFAAQPTRLAWGTSASVAPTPWGYPAAVQPTVPAVSPWGGGAFTGAPAPTQPGMGGLAPNPSVPVIQPWGTWQAPAPAAATAWSQPVTAPTLTPNPWALAMPQPAQPVAAPGVQPVVGWSQPVTTPPQAFQPAAAPGVAGPTMTPQPPATNQLLPNPWVPAAGAGNAWWQRGTVPNLTGAATGFPVAAPAPPATAAPPAPNPLGLPVLAPTPSPAQ